MVVVVALEIVHVHEQQGQRLALALRLGHELPDVVVEHAAVVEPRQRVAHGQPVRVAAVQELLAPLVFAPVGDKAEHQRRQRQHHFQAQHLGAHLGQRRGPGQRAHAGEVEQRHQQLHPRADGKRREHAQHDHHQDGRFIRRAEHLVGVDGEGRAAAQRDAQDDQDGLQHPHGAAPERAGQRQHDHRRDGHAHRVQGHEQRLLPDVEQRGVDAPQVEQRIAAPHHQADGAEPQHAPVLVAAAVGTVLGLQRCAEAQPAETLAQLLRVLRGGCRQRWLHGRPVVGMRPHGRPRSGSVPHIAAGLDGQRSQRSEAV